LPKPNPQQIVSKSLKSFLFLSSVLLFFYLFVSQAYSEENNEKSAGVISDFKSEIEKFKNLANEPLPNSPPADLPLSNYESALSFFNRGDENAAIQKLKMLLGSTNATSWLKKEVHTTLGYIYLDQIRPKDALEEFSFIEKENEFKERALFGIAMGLLQQEEYVKTIAIFDELVNDFPNGEYTPEGHSKMGYCYSKLLSFKNAVESYQKALKLFNKQLLAEKNLLQSSDRSILFQKNFIFSNPQPEWNLFFVRIKNDREGQMVLHESEIFFNLEDRLNRNPAYRQSSPQYQQSLIEARTQIQDVFRKFIRGKIIEEKRLSQISSTEVALELARNMVLEQSLPGQNNSNR
jgi:tetratricopeptide (TPR) repeat protein